MTDKPKRTPPPKTTPPERPKVIAPPPPAHVAIPCKVDGYVSDLPVCPVCGSVKS